MQQTQLMQQSFYVRHFHQRMIMIRQHAPRKGVARARREHSQQVARKIIHSLRAVPEMRMMLEARCRDEKSQMPKVGPVRRRMPRIPALLAPGEQLRALLLVKFTPKIAWGGVARLAQGARVSVAFAAAPAQL